MSKKPLSTKKKREYLLNSLSLYLKTSKSIMEYLHINATTRQGKLVCNKSIKNIEQALIKIREIKHIELLEYLNATYIGNNVVAHSLSGHIVTNKKFQYWDSEEGFAEFLEEMKEQKEKSLAKEEEKKKEQEAIKKAKEEGKKVEMVYDDKTKTVRPLIIEENQKA